MMETIDQRLGIDRCEGALQTLFALTLMELAEFEWRRPERHGWEVGRWPGLRLTLLAQPESGPHHDGNRRRLHRSDVRHDDT